MSIKSGDLAVIVKSMYGNEGKIVTCVKYLGVVNFADRPASTAWEISPRIPTRKGRTTNTVEAISLRPIRPDESPEESTEAMRLLTQLPQKEKV